MYLSIILPAYKAANALANQVPPLINYLNSLHKEYEIIIVDDGSDDNDATRSIAVKNKCKFFQHPKNSGKGAAVRTGMLHATGKFRLFTDADIPFEYGLIEKIIYYLDFKEFDLVIGDRTVPGSAYFNDIAANRKIASAVFSFLVGRFIITGVFDSQCGIKGFRDAIANDIFSKGKLEGFSFDVELIYIALKRNYDIKKIPVVLRNSESSSVSLLRHSAGMAIDLLKIKWNHVNGLYAPAQSEKANEKI